MTRRAKTFFAACFAALLGVGMAFVPTAAEAQGRVRIKDIADFEGVRQNILVG